jgi:hypothetical protein
MALNTATAVANSAASFAVLLFSWDLCSSPASWFSDRGPKHTPQRQYLLVNGKVHADHSHSRSAQKMCFVRSDVLAVLLWMNSCPRRSSFRMPSLSNSPAA